MAAINQQFPQAPTSRVVDDKGDITLPWHQFLVSLWNRTGGSGGQDANGVLDSLGAALPGVTLFRGPRGKWAGIHS